MKKDKCQKCLPFIVREFMWKCMQEGRFVVEVEDTSLTFSATAQQVSKAVRRFNETGHEFKWPGFKFSAEVIDAYAIRITARQTEIRTNDEALRNPTALS